MSSDLDATATAGERRYAIQARRDSEAERLRHMLDNMRYNKAYRYAVEDAGGDEDGTLLEAFRTRFRAYREAWRGQPRAAIEAGLVGDRFRESGYGPLCVDVETAAVCDLACPFCFRQYVATPDKVMREEMFRTVVDQCRELDVPSIKLNWRGEPLLQPKLPQFIDYAKRNRVLETIINTNAVTLDERKGRDLIEAGLDLMIYSFDGGTKETYEKMRVGRFQDNRFESVYGNIRRFADLRDDAGAKFPRTKIQMILTAETYDERDSFFDLFSGVVDDVSVKAYTERGGDLPDLDEQTAKRLRAFIRHHGIPADAHYWRDLEGNLFVEAGRLPCEQPYQRLLVTYDGRVSMCCYDWGSQYPVGYVDQEALDTGDAEYEKVLRKAQSGARGFEAMAKLKMPKKLNEPEPVVQRLVDIWHGAPIDHVRRRHLAGKIEEVNACRQCPFKETYRWLKVPPA